MSFIKLTCNPGNKILVQTRNITDFYEFDDGMVGVYFANGNDYKIQESLEQVIALLGLSQNQKAAE